MNMNKTKISIGAGFYPGILFGIRTYKESVIWKEIGDTELSENDVVTDITHFAIYIPFVDIVVTIESQSDEPAT